MNAQSDLNGIISRSQGSSLTHGLFVSLSLASIHPSIDTSHKKDKETRKRVSLFKRGEDAECQRVETILG